MPCAASPSAIAFTSSGCRLQSWAIWSNDSEVFSTSHTAVAFGIRGAVAIGKSPLRSARPSGRSHSTSSRMTGRWPEYRRRNASVQPPRVPWLGHGRRASDRLFVAIPAADGAKQQEKGMAMGKRFWPTATLAFAFFVADAAAQARTQDFPVRPVHVIVPFAPGGGVDI